MDNPNSNRPKRRTAIVARELKRFNVDIAALSETRRAADGQLHKHMGGYTFYWKGLAEEERRIHGIGFAIKNELVGRMSETPIGISECLMTLRWKLSDTSYATYHHQRICSNSDGRR